MHPLGVDKIFFEVSDLNKAIHSGLSRKKAKLEKNKILAQQAAQIWSTRNFSKLHELYAKDCVHQQQHQQKAIVVSGIDAWRKYMEDFLHTHPDYQEEIIDQVAEGDKVVSVLDCKTSALHWSGVVIDRIEQGKIKETSVWFKRNCG